MSTLLRETQPAQNRIAGYLPQHADENGNYVPTGDEFPLPVLIKMITGMMPIQFQETLKTQDTVKQLSAVTFTANSWKQGEWIDVTGYENLVVTALNDAAVSMVVGIDFSHDKVNVISTGNQTVSSTLFGEYSAPVKAQFARVSVKNGDANPHVISSWIFRKS